jgi:membrane fusion protein (multidrug efflux system)
VDITVDSYPGSSWKGVVESISPASGSEFSILPAQNSSGNWVKVVQRIPVRVKILSGPAGLVLRDGMSAEISINTNHHRHLSDLF